MFHIVFDLACPILLRSGEGKLQKFLAGNCFAKPLQLAHLLNSIRVTLPLPPALAADGICKVEGHGRDKQCNG
jgi:hypothetical protein